jgi:hypothetical protein
MCGETFSSKFSPDQKAAAAKAHPLARPGRWSVVFYYGSASKDDPRHFHEHDRAYFDRDSAHPTFHLEQGGSRNGFATRAEAEAALKKFGRLGEGWFVLPPLEESGDHRIRTALASGAVSTNDLADFVDAVLNNRQAQFEPLRERFAAASLVAPAPAAPKLTRAEAAQALVEALVPLGHATAELWSAWLGSGPGNAVAHDDFSDEDGAKTGAASGAVYYAFDPAQSRLIHAAVKAYFEAEDDRQDADEADEPGQRWGLFSTAGDGHGQKPGYLFHSYSTVLATRAAAEAAQKQHGGRIARIVRDDDAMDGWSEKP